MGQIRWTLEARDWLREIHSHIASDDLEAADRVVEGILDKVRLLEDFPELGYCYQSRHCGEVRILLYGHYRIAYLVGPERHVDVLGVFHGALDVSRYL